MGVNIFYGLCVFTSICITSQAGRAKAIRKVANLSQCTSWDLNSVPSEFKPHYVTANVTYYVN
jgi:hypothetical protein